MRIQKDRTDKNIKSSVHYNLHIYPLIFDAILKKRREGEIKKKDIRRSITFFLLWYGHGKNVVHENIVESKFFFRSKYFS